MSYQLSVLFWLLSMGTSARYAARLTQASPARRVVWSLYASVASFVVLAGSIAVRGNAPLEAAYTYYAFLLLNAAVLAVAQAYMQSGIMVICTQLTIDGALMGYMLMGQALQGVSGSVINLVSTILAVQLGQRHPPSPTRQAHENAQAAMVVVLTTVVLQCITLACFAAASRVPAVAERMRKWTDAPAPSEDARERPVQDDWTRLVRVQREILPWSASIFLLFMVTLGMYPVLTAQVRPTHKASGDALLANPSVFVALHIVVMNAGDFIGRRLPVLSRCLLIERGWVAVVSATARFLFLPFFFACNLPREDGTTGWAFPDLVFLGLVGLLGMTTGSNSTSILISGPKAVHLQDPAARSDVEQDRLLGDTPPGGTEGDADAAAASLLLAFWLVLGLMAGSAFSFVVLALM